jgi:predicted nuclease of predicted toxin-antitoxin system
VSNAGDHADRVRLLFDENLAPSLVSRLADRFPGSLHVRTAGLASAADDEIWRYAQQQGLVIVSKDDDFRQRSMLLGAPPRVIWLRLGNCSTTEIEQVLRSRELDVRQFYADGEASLLVIARG